MTTGTTTMWGHFNPVKITAGVGSLDRVASIATARGRWLLVTSAGFTRRGVTARVRSMLEANGSRVLAVHDAITANPELDDLESISASFEHDPLVGIIGLGGGSVLDAAKVLAATIPHSSDRLLHRTLREGRIHRWQRTLSLVAIPTTSGTGSEVTPFATVWDSVTQKKYSVAGERIFPDECILDPALTISLPRDETLYTGLDATSHALESLWNRNRTPVSEALAIGALERIADALPRVLHDLGNCELRDRMQQASLMAGMAISHTRTAIAHSISYPLTLRFGVPHGLACSFTLDAILRRHMQALGTTGDLRRLFELISKMLGALGLPAHLSRYASEADVRGLIPEMTTPGRADNFPYPHDLAQILRESFDHSCIHVDYH